MRGNEIEDAYVTFVAHTPPVLYGLAIGDMLSTVGCWVDSLVGLGIPARIKST